MTDSPPPPAISPVELLRQFPAEGVVMTTFTLSLTWFESYLLRNFEHHATRHVALITDPVGMADAVGEGLAAGPGVRYALPVSYTHLTLPTSG